MALRNSFSTHSSLSAGAAPLANVEDETACECNDAGVYYYSSTRVVLRNNNNSSAVDEADESGPLLTTGSTSSAVQESIQTGDSSDSGTFTLSSSISTHLSDLIQAKASSGTQRDDQDSESSDDDDNCEGFGERESVGNSDEELLKNNKMQKNDEINNAERESGGLRRHHSLEALVTCFDQCLNAALGDMSRDITQISNVVSFNNNNGTSTVQLGTQEELVSDDPLWLHLSQTDTAARLNESIDWSQNVVREQLLLPALRMAHQNHHHQQQHFDNENSGALYIKDGLYKKPDTTTTTSVREEKEVDDGFSDLYNMHAMAGLYESDGNVRNHQAPRDKLQTADEVIEEIDKIFDENVQQPCANITSAMSSSILENDTEYDVNNFRLGGSSSNSRYASSDTNNSMYSASAAAVANVLSEIEEKLQSMPIPLYEDKLKDLSIPDLIELMADLEKLTQQFSEILVHELALRDELQFEKEIKNTFITLVLRVQNQRKDIENADRASASSSSTSSNNKRRKNSSKLSLKSPTSPFSPTKPPYLSAQSPSSSWSTNAPLTSPNAATSTSFAATAASRRYLSTAIPYQPGVSTSLRHLQAIIKILRAMSDNSPTTTTLLTDYILNVLCPKDDL